MQQLNLSNHFLIAMPNLAEPPFSRGVALLCQHDENGAVGLLVNQLSEYRFGDVLAQMKLECADSELADAPVLIGGPVQQERGFVLHRPLMRLPESHLKYAVGVVLSSFGVFFLGEGLGTDWPGGDVALLYVAASLLAVSQAAIATLAREPVAA